VRLNISQSPGAGLRSISGVTGTKFLTTCERAGGKAAKRATAANITVAVGRGACSKDIQVKNIAITSEWAELMTASPRGESLLG
jgi:hypothetical protein